MARKGIIDGVAPSSESLDSLTLTSAPGVAVPQTGMGTARSSTA